jgi:CheY-like chemotaxis protein
VRRQDSDEVELHFTVSDTGIGIPEQKQEAIFNSFEQADGTMTRRYGGTGLGLSISRQLVEMMGGRIWVTSRVGRGSTFHFTVRLSIVPQAPDQVLNTAELQETIRLVLGNGNDPARKLLVTRHTLEEHKNQRRLKILLAEDNLINQKMVVRILEKPGHNVKVVDNGQIALEMLAQEHFDLVFMDVQMPVMNGFEATGAIRTKEQRSGGHIPIIAMTAHALKQDRERCLQAGMDDYISKPINPQQVYHVLRHWIEAI